MFSFTPHTTLRRRQPVWLLLLVVILGSAVGIASAARQPAGPPRSIIIDTDTGVDDAAAIVALLQQQQVPVAIRGFTTVAGNATVENATNNVLTILDAANRRDLPVVVGAADPLVQPRSRTGALVHGPDGLWFAGMQHPHDIAALPHDPITFYREMGQRYPGSTLIALGPLTNLAQTVQRDAGALKLFKEIIVLGGAKHGGNRTPVAEANIASDPEAAQVVLSAGLPLTFVTLDAFATVTVTDRELDALSKGSPAAQLIAQPLRQYIAIDGSTVGRKQRITGAIPDAAAVLYALDPSLGTSQSSLIKVATDNGPARGQTIIGISMNERIPMIADDAELSALTDSIFSDPAYNMQAAIGAILMREPDNAKVVLTVDAPKMQRVLLQALTR